jgi:hypothetical protein
LLVLPAGDRPLIAESSDSQPASEAICFTFTGARRSELEPCGCHGLQTGGVDREARYYDDLRKAYGTVIPMEAGIWIDPYQTPNERLKTDYLLRAMDSMGYEVFNMTPYELAFGTTYTLSVDKDHSIKRISANLLVAPRGEEVPNPGRPFFEPYYIREVPRRDGGKPIRVGVLGVTDARALEQMSLQRMKAICRDMPAFKLLDVAETLRTNVPRLRPQVDYLIVLGLMNIDVAQKLVREIEGIDLFVTTAGAQRPTMVQHLGKTAMLQTGYLSRYFTKAVAEFDKENKPIRTNGGLVAIRTDAPREPAITELLEAYKEDTKNLARRIAVARERSRFVGHGRCLGCHRNEYIQWTRTPHNLAWSTLTRRNQQYNPDCVKCHVTGYQEKDGFVDAMQTGHLVKVQCEVCHGPGREHVDLWLQRNRLKSQGKIDSLEAQPDDPKMIATPPRELCIQCHNEEHDPNFDYEKDLPLTSHTNTRGPFRRPDKEKAPMYKEMGNVPARTPTPVRPPPIRR